MIDWRQVFIKALIAALAALLGMLGGAAFF